MDDLILRVYGDSLGMPRVHEGVACEKTYPELIRTFLEDSGRRVRLYNRSRGAIRITELSRQASEDSTYFGAADHTVLIIQCGIVDCAPRPLPRLVRSFIGKTPAPVRTRVVQFLHRNRARLIRIGPPWRETAPSVFANTFRVWLERAAGECRRAYVVNIAPTNDAMDNHSPGLSASIRRYNDMIADAVTVAPTGFAELIDVHAAISVAPDGVARCVNQQDGHHITAEGHALYAKLLWERMKTDNAEKGAA